VTSDHSEADCSSLPLVFTWSKAELQTKAYRQWWLITHNTQHTHTRYKHCWLRAVYRIHLLSNTGIYFA